MTGCEYSVHQRVSLTVCRVAQQPRPPLSTVGPPEAFGSGWSRAVGIGLDLILPCPCVCCGRSVRTVRPPFGLCNQCLCQWPERTTGRCHLCGRPIATLSEEDFQCGTCFGHRSPFDRLFIGWDYLPPVADSLRAFKFGHLKSIGRQIVDRLMESLTTAEIVTLQQHDLVTWIPLWWPRRVLRGYDQAELLAKRLAHHLGLPCRALLRRRRGTRPQSKLALKDRGRNLGGAFAPTSHQPALRSVLLVDDVITSGATLKEAARTLRRSEIPSVACLAIARTPHPDEIIAAQQNMDQPNFT